MRRFFLGLAILLTMIAAAPRPAWAGNQEMAQRISDTIQESGQLSAFQMMVRYQNGTCWLEGRVRDEAQLQTALKLAHEVKGVERVVNGLTIGPVQASATTDKPAAKAEKASPTATAKNAEANPLRRDGQIRSKAQPLASSFTTAPAQRVNASEPTAPPRTFGQRFLSELAPGGANEPRPRASAVQPVSVMQPMRLAQQPAASMPAPPVAAARSVAGPPLPMYAGTPAGPAPARYDQPNMPNYAWPSYASYPNYAAVTYPRQYSPTAWPYIGPFYPYPQVPLGWRKVTLQWDAGWWMLDFKDEPSCVWWR